jgi:hypothetical protein
MVKPARAPSSTVSANDKTPPGGERQAKLGYPNRTAEPGGRPLALAPSQVADLPSSSHTEAGDEEGAYEVEVTRADGSQVDVHLDKGFDVLSQADDNDQGGEDDSGDKD